MNWIQTVRPKFDQECCFNEVGNGKGYLNYLALKTSCEDFSMKVL